MNESIQFNRALAQKQNQDFATLVKIENIPRDDVNIIICILGYHFAQNIAQSGLPGGGSRRRLGSAHETRLVCMFHGWDLGLQVFSFF